MKLQCAECKSERHHTVLHPGPAPCSVPEHGGEEKTSPQSHVTNKCTKVCGGDLTDQSVSKVFLVKVYPAGHRDKVVKLYAIMDEQSNWSLLCSQFFVVFDDKSLSASYTLRTCAGVKE